MNPDRTKGGNFKGVIAYITHDQDKGQSKDRVSFTHCLNMRTEDTEKAAKLMAWTASHAEDLKRQSGEKVTGRKMEKPVYHLSLNWHPSEKPTQAEMIEAGKSVLEVLGMKEHQAVFAAHNDKDHQHLHIVVNRVHPENGTSPSLSHDQNILQKWAYEYEKAHGKIWCKERVAKYDDDLQVRKAAQEQSKQEKEKQKPQEQNQSQKWQYFNLKQPQSKMRQAWEAERKTQNTTSLRANEIRAKYGEKAAKLSEQSKQLYSHQRQQKQSLYQWYKEEKKRLWKNRGCELSKVWQQTKDKQQQSWEQLKERQKTEYVSLMKEIRKTEYRMRKMPKSLLGFVCGAIDMYFSYKQMGEQRQRHKEEREALSAYQKGQRERNIGGTREIYQERAGELRRYYLQEKDNMQQRHSMEKKLMQGQWANLNAERQAEWDKYRAFFGVFRKDEKREQKGNFQNQAQTKQQMKPQDRSFSR